METIYLAGGCFWGIERYFDQMKEILETEVGYANGNKENPSYEEVCTKNIGFAETVKIKYDSKQISLEEILKRFYQIINPISINKQGNDIGIQYRTGIFYTKEEEKKRIEKSVQELQKKYEKPIQIEIKLLQNYYKAEMYHQKYLRKNPDGYCHIPRKLFY